MPKTVDHEERRRALARAAVDAIAANGLDDVKLADIARRAGVTTGALAHYFPDKDAVLAAALEDVCVRLLQRMEAQRGVAGLADLSGVLPVSKESRAEWRVWLAYWGRAPFSERLRIIHQQYYVDIETALTDLLRYDNVDDAPTVAAAIIAAIDGVGTRATLEPDDWPPERQHALLHLLLSPLFATFGPRPS